MSPRAAASPLDIVWTGWDAVVEVAALAVGVLLVPLAALPRALKRGQTRERVGDFRRETVVAHDQFRAAGRQANDFLHEYLEAHRQLRDRFLRSVRTPAEARFAWEVMQRAEEQLLEGARAASGSPPKAGAPDPRPTETEAGED